MILKNRNVPDGRMDRRKQYPPLPHKDSLRGYNNFLFHCFYILANEDSGDCQVLLLPTEECIYRLGQFGLEIYPGVEWPKLEEFS